MNKSFGEKLKEARNRKNLKQSELAKQLGVKNTTISNWENNISKPDLDMLSYICGVLEVKVSYFLDAKLPEDEITIQEFEIIKKYRSLDSHGQETVNIILDRESTRVAALNGRDARIKELEASVSESATPNYLVLNAAHERTDIEQSAEDKLSDYDMMSDENF